MIVWANPEERLSKCEEKSYRGKKKLSRERFLTLRPKAEAKKCSQDALFYQGNFFITQGHFLNRCAWTFMAIDCFFAHLATFHMNNLGMNSEHLKGIEELR